MPSPYSPSQPLLCAKLLGLPEFTIDGRILSGRAYQKLHALLAFLLMEHERPHTRESLSALLWPDHDKERALRNLRLGLHHLRQGLGRHGAALIVGDRRTIRIAPGHPFLLDALELGAPLPSGASTASLEHLVALYRGDFLTGLALPGCEEFEAWTRSHADTLRRTVLRLLERLGDECEAHGEVEHALQAARRRIQIEPWSDPAHRQVMRLLARAGQTDAALEQFRAFATTLQQELGTAPQADTVALVERIRRGEPLQGEAPPAAPAAPGERQLLTVIAIRSLDQPRVGEDPELWAERISRFTARLAALVLELGGTLAATPDGAWVGAFGFPHAEEGAARRAVQAALRIAALGDEERGESQFAVGVHTAVALSDGVHADRGGMVTAVATALARAAEGGGVLISGATELQTRSLFEIEPQEDALPAAAGSAFHVLRPSGAVDRLDRAPLTPLRGRRDELRLLLDLWRAAQGGQAEAVLLLGEAGIGKSRLVHTVSEQLRAADNHVERALRCRAEFRDAAYYPIIELIESLAGYAPNDAAPLKNAAVARLLDEHGADGVKALPFIARLLGLADDPALAALAPAQLREHTEQAVLALFLNPAKRHPLLFVCEDLHWADPSTLGFLSRFIGAAEPGYRILALLTARPGERPPALAGLRTLALGPLDDGEVAAMVRSIAGDDTDRVLPHIARLTDGIPLFVEELTRALQENATDAPPVPQTLLELLAARLDRLAEHKPMAQLAAVIGRDFTLELIAAVLDVSAPAAAARLQPLVQAAILLRREGIQGTLYQFRHALFQEAAYASQLRDAREKAHRRVAETLVARFEHQAAQNPEQVARHFSAAALPAQAIPWWSRAGRFALRASSNEEAVDHLRAGLALLSALPPDARREEQELDLLLPLGQALLGLHGYGSPQAAALYDRAFALCREHGADPRRFEAVWGQWMVSSSREESSFAVSAALARELLATARACASPALQINAHSAMANVALWRAEFATTCEHALAALALNEAHPRETRLDGHDPGVASLAYLSWACFYQGKVAEARGASARAIALADRLDHPDTRCFALIFAAVLQRWMRETETSVRLTQEAMALAGQYRLVLWQASGAMLMGWAQAQAGDPGGIELLAASVAGVRQAMPGVVVSFLHPLAEAQGFLGQSEKQLQVIDAALQAAERLDEHFHLPDLQRLKGEALYRQGRREPALAALHEALEIGERQGARSMVFRARLTLAEWLYAEGGTHEAAAILGAALEAWDEATDTADGRAGAALLRRCTTG